MCGKGAACPAGVIPAILARLPHFCRPCERPPRSTPTGSDRAPATILGWIPSAGPPRAHGERGPQPRCHHRPTGIEAHRHRPTGRCRSAAALTSKREAGGASNALRAGAVWPGRRGASLVRTFRVDSGRRRKNSSWRIRPRFPAPRSAARWHEPARQPALTLGPLRHPRPHRCARSRARAAGRLAVPGGPGQVGRPPRCGRPTDPAATDRGEYEAHSARPCSPGGARLEAPEACWHRPQARRIEAGSPADGFRSRPPHSRSRFWDSTPWPA
jgi:hypothetical protein